MEYRVELLNDFNVVGMECDSKNDNAEITKVWEVFNEREKEIDTPFNEASYGLSYDMKADGSFRYMAGMKVETIKAIPKGMKVMAIQGGKFAVFTFKDEVSKMGAFFNDIYTKFLPELNLAPDHRIWFEYYDERFCKNGECDIYVPIK